MDHSGDKALIVAAGIYYDIDNGRSRDIRYFACTITHAFHLKDGQEVQYVKSEESRTEVQEEKGVGEWEV